jgi:hypothetical protein
VPTSCLLQMLPSCKYACNACIEILLSKMLSLLTFLQFLGVNKGLVFVFANIHPAESSVSLTAGG